MGSVRENCGAEKTATSYRSTHARTKSHTAGHGEDRSMWQRHIQREPGARRWMNPAGCGSWMNTMSSERSSVRRFCSVVWRKISTSCSPRDTGLPWRPLWIALVTAKNSSPPRMTSQRASMPTSRSSGISRFRISATPPPTAVELMFCTRRPRSCSPRSLSSSIVPLPTNGA